MPDGTEGILIFTRKGAYRGGHSHDKAEVSLVLSGRMEYRKRTSDGRALRFIQKPGDLLRNGPGEPHLAHALEDGWLFDYRLGVRAGETVTTSYPRYRRMVDARRR